METTTPFAVQASLTRALEREAAAGNEVALTVKALTRSDYSRLTFWGGDQVTERPDLERLFVLDDEQRICVEQAASDPHLSACVGYVALAKSRPQPTAWLLDGDGQLIDIAGKRRRALGFYGVQLRASEVGNWSPQTPSAVAESNVQRLKVA